MRPDGSEAWWRFALTDPNAHFEPLRGLFRRLPSAPRCKLCGGPFKGLGGVLLRPFGMRPWDKNPTLCVGCFKAMERFGPGGAEIPCTLLFADIRGSTGLAEHSTPSEFAALLSRFYALASQAIIDENGIVDKFVGDEVVALFIPGFSGSRHAAPAIRVARRLLVETGHGEPDGPWLHVGAGIHSGTAFVGAMAVAGEVVNFTALGDTVNAAARLASAAAAGEVLISEGALVVADVDLAGAERRELHLRGREAPIAVRVGTVQSLRTVDGRRNDAVGGS
jgi:adenylate cyclase